MGSTAPKAATPSGARSRPARGADCPDNRAAARLLRELAARLALEGDPYVPRAYQRAAESLEREPRSIARILAQQGVEGLDDLPSIGSSIARTLREFIETGRIGRLERMRRTTPVDVMGLLAVDGIGPKRLKTLWEELRVRSVEDLEQAVAHKSVQGLPGFGVRSEEKLREVLRVRKRKRGAIPLARASKVADGLKTALEAHPDVLRCCVAGSIRRGRKKVNDIDLVVVSNDAEAVARDFLARPDIAFSYSRGPQRISVSLTSSIDVDVRIVPPASFGSALLYFTGSREHTLALRQLARAQGLRLNEYGLYRGKRRIAGRTEEDVYAGLALPYIPPEERTGAAEISKALRAQA